LALLVLVPGITIAEPDSAAVRLEELQNLDALPTLVSLLGSHLDSEPLSATLERQNVADALSACINEYLDLPASESLSGALPLDFEHFHVDFTNFSNPASVVAQIIHRAARYTNVYRRELDQDGNTMRTVPLKVGYGALEGIDPVEIVRNPGGTGVVIVEDHVDLHCGTGIGEVQYWATGVGWGSGGLDPSVDYGLSPDFDQHSREAAQLSVMTYIVRPLLTILTGAFINDGMLSLIVAEAQWSEALARLAYATSQSEFISALNDLILVCVSILIIALSVYFPLFEWVWALLTGFWAELVLLGVVIFWTETPQVSMFPLPNPIDQIDCLPVVIATTPEDHSQGVPVSTIVTATFSTDMDPTTISEGTFRLDGVAGSVTYDAPSRTAVFTPSADLERAQGYEAVVSSVVADTAGLRMSDDYSWSFTTVTGNEIWTARFEVGNRVDSSTSCSTGSECGCWNCPESGEARLLGIGDVRTFLDIIVEVDDGSISHASDGWGVGANFGSFRIENASLGLSGTYADSGYDFVLIFSGSARDRYFCELFDAPGPFEVVFSVSNAVRNGNTITGSFDVTASIETPPGSCSTFWLQDEAAGTVTVVVNPIHSRVPLAQDPPNGTIRRTGGWDGAPSHRN
jgi:hypothetical protein